MINIRFNKTIVEIEKMCWCKATFSSIILSGIFLVRQQDLKTYIRDYFRESGSWLRDLAIRLARNKIIS